MVIGTVVLAAGGSTRLGHTPKQLILREGKPLVRYMTETALGLGVGPVVVVLGAYHEQVAAALAGLPVRLGYNRAWSDGLASSLRVGLECLSVVETGAVLMLVADQPHVTGDLLGQLIMTQHRTGRGIVASAYVGQVGVPALFSQDYWDQLLKLTGDCGARQLIRRYAGDCATVDFEQGEIDLDTPEDVARWQSNQPV